MGETIGCDWEFLQGLWDEMIGQPTRLITLNLART